MHALKKRSYSERVLLGCARVFTDNHIDFAWLMCMPLRMIANRAGIAEKKTEKEKKDEEGGSEEAGGGRARGGE